MSGSLNGRPDGSSNGLDCLEGELAGALLMCAALGLCALGRVQASQPYSYGAAGALAGVEVVFGAKPGRHSFRANPNAERSALLRLLG
jgi:hypothetical protein